MRSLSFTLEFSRLPNTPQAVPAAETTSFLELAACLHHTLLQELLVPLASRSDIPTGTLSCFRWVASLDPLGQQANWRLTSSCKAVPAETRGHCPQELGLEKASPEVGCHPPQPPAQLADYWGTAIANAC